MILHRSLSSVKRTAILAVSLAGCVCPVLGQSTTEDLQTQILLLKEHNQSLQRSLAEANKSEKIATEQLNQVRERLEALGKNLLDGGNDRLIQAAADLQIANERNAAIENAATRLVSNVGEFLRQAVISDPESRLRVESSLRELDSCLGIRHKPRPDVRLGTLQQSKIVSIDQESGMMVLNIGESQGAKIGMTFQISHGQQPYGKAILADIRKGISGAFVESLGSPSESPRVGDTAILITQAKE